MAKIEGIPDFPRITLPIQPKQFQCECVCVEVQKVLDGRKQQDCAVFTRDLTFAAIPPTLPLVDINQQAITIVDWAAGDDIVCLGGIFKENLKDEIFVIEKPPQNFTVTPLIGSNPPAAVVNVVVTPGKNSTPSGVPGCLVKNTVLLQLQNNTPGRTPTTGYIEVCPVSFTKNVVLFYPDPQQIGLVSVKTESSWEILDCAVEQILGVIRFSVTVGAFIIVKTWAEAQLVMTAYGECDWELLPPTLPENECDVFKTRPFPPFNPAQLQDFLTPPPPPPSD